MPTLPDRATSITGLLADVASTDASSAVVFDWRALVHQARPGTATDSQRAQAARFARVQDDLRQWADAHGIPQEHLEETALYATVSSPPAMPHEQVVVLAMIIYWIYILDDFLDRRDFRHLAALPAYAGRAEIDRCLDGIFRDILPPARRGSRHRPALWPFGGQPAPQLAPIPGDQPLSSALLRATLRSALDALHVEAGRLPRASAAADRFGRRVVARELVACARAMRQEALWNVSLARSPDRPRLPLLATYLRGGTRSIGMLAVTGVVATFEERPWQAWNRGQAALKAAGEIVRLTNDLHTYFADAAEGKVTAITIRLQEMGVPPIGLDPDTSDEVRQAQESLFRDLAQAVVEFNRTHPELGDGPLGYCARHLVAFALAVYGDGSRFSGPSRAA